MVNPRIIAKVKVKDTDESTGIRGRTLNVQVRNGQSFDTPSKPVVIKDFKAKARNPHYRGKLPGDLAVLPEYIEGRIFEEYLHENGRVNKIHRDLSQYSDSSSFMVNVPSLQMKPINPGKSIAMVTLKMQLDVPTLSGICMPLLEASAADYGKALEYWIKMSDECGKMCVPQISVSEDVPTFEAKLDNITELSKTGAVSMVDVVYGDPRKFRHQYGMLWEKRNELEAIVHCSKAPAKGDRVCDYMNTHPVYDMLLYGIDSMSAPRSPPRPFFPKKDCTEVADIEKYEWADQGTASMILGNHWESVDGGHLTCSCPICRGRSQSEIVETYSRKTDGCIDQSAMKDVSLIHDHLSFTEELGPIRKRIKGHDMAGYRKGKIDARNKFISSASFGDIRQFPKRRS